VDHEQLRNQTNQTPGAIHRRSARCCCDYHAGECAADASIDVVPGSDPIYGSHTDAVVRYEPNAYEGDASQPNAYEGDARPQEGIAIARHAECGQTNDPYRAGRHLTSINVPCDPSARCRYAEARDSDTRNKGSLTSGFHNEPIYSITRHAASGHRHFTGNATAGDPGIVPYQPRCDPNDNKPSDAECYPDDNKPCDAGCEPYGFQRGSLRSHDHWSGHYGS
jgi:hypothetical protein